VKQAQSVEIAYLMNGEVLSSRRLSRKGEWRAGLGAMAAATALAAAAGGVVGLALLAAHRVVYGPAFVALWIVVGLGSAALAAARAADRARTFRIGTSIDDDAFSATPLALVRRTAAGYRIRVSRGFSGRLPGGRAPLLVESLTRDGAADLPLPPDSRAELMLGTATFVVTSAPDTGPAPALPNGILRRLVRRVAMPLELAALASVLCAVPVGAQIREADMRSAIPAHATPWEIEKLLRAEAQIQARSLHQCFDTMPIACQRPGYVGVGVSLSREGEIRSHWIARSTYGGDCPVNECLSEVVGNWFFEPLPESMKVILPVQVLRTDKPLPYGAARAAEDEERSAARVAAQTAAQDEERAGAALARRGADEQGGRAHGPAVVTPLRPSSAGHGARTEIN